MYQTKRLILKHPQFNDWPVMYQNVWSQPETARYMLWEVTRSEEDARNRMLRSIAFQKEHTAWFVYEKTDNTPIGFAGFCQIAAGVYEDTGIAIGPNYVGMGYGSEVLNKLTEIAKYDHHARQFVASCRSQNEASRKMLLSCGFRYTHTENRMDVRDNTPYLLEFYEKAL